MARAVGLDIGSRMIKVVEVTGSPKSFKVQRVAVRPIPEPQPGAEGELMADPDVLASETVREIFESLKLPRDDVCAVFDSGTSVLREIQVPFLEDDQIRKVVKFEAENHLHSHALEDVVINWIKTGQSRDGSRLTIFASPKTDVQRLLLLSRGAGVEPSSVDLDVTAIYTACDAAGVFAESPNVILIDVGARSTSLMLVSEGRPLVVRSFLLGTDHVESGVSKELHVSLEEGRRRARLPAGPRADDLMATSASLTPADETEKSLEELEEDVASDMRRDFVRKLHREAMRSLVALQAEQSPDRVLIAGGGSLLPGLVESLRDKFDLPVERLDLSSYIDWKDQGSDPEFTQASCPAAVGAALRMLGHNPLGLEILKDEYAPTNRFDVIKGALATFVTLLFVVLLGFAYVASQKKRAEQTRYNEVARVAARLFQTAELAYRTKVLNEQPDEAQQKINTSLMRMAQDHTRINLYRSQMLGRFRKLQNELGLGTITPIQSALKVWLEVYRALSKIPRNEYGEWMRVLKMEVKQRNAVVRIEVDDQPALDKIRAQFEQSAYFRERARNNTRVVEVGPVSQQKGHWQRDYEFRFKEEE